MFTPTSAFVFAPSTTYWLVVGGMAGSTTFDWEANNPGITPTGIATHAGQYFGSTGAPPTGASSTLNSYAITATAVQATPEPSALAALGVGAVALLRRRRK